MERDRGRETGETGVGRRGQMMGREMEGKGLKTQREGWRLPPTIGFRVGQEGPGPQGLLLIPAWPLGPEQQATDG